MNITPNASVSKATPFVDQPIDTAENSTQSIDLFNVFSEKYGIETQNDNASDADLSHPRQRRDPSQTQDNIADGSIIFALADQNVNTPLDAQTAPSIRHQPNSPQAATGYDNSIPEAIALPLNLTNDIETALSTINTQDTVVAKQATGVKFETSAPTLNPQDEGVTGQVPDIKPEVATPTTNPQEIVVAKQATGVKLDTATPTTNPQEIVVAKQTPDVAFETSAPTTNTQGINAAQQTQDDKPTPDDKPVRTGPIPPNLNARTELNNLTPLSVANDLVTREAELTRTPVQSLDIDVLSEVRPKVDRAFTPTADVKDALPKLSLTTTGTIEPELINVTPTTVGEATASLATVTAPAAETLIRTPQATQTGLQLPTSHPAIQTVAQNLIKVQETKSGVSVQLDPPEMGRVFIDFQFETDKSVTATIRSDIAETSAALKDKADFFQQILKDNGFNDVTLSFEQNDTSNENAFSQNDKAPSYFMTETELEIEKQANLVQPVKELYKQSPDTAIDIKL